MSAMIAIIEARRCGGEASGRNGGFCAPSISHGVSNALKRWPDEAEQLIRLGRQNLDELAADLQRFNINVEFERQGKLNVASQPWQVDGLRSMQRNYARFGIDCEWLEGRDLAPPLLGHLKSSVIPVYDYSLVSEPLSNQQLAAIGWTGRYGIADSGNQFHYLRKTADNRILWAGFDAIYHFGGRRDETLTQRPQSFQRLAEQFHQTFPALGNVRFTHAWGGIIDTSARTTMFTGANIRAALPMPWVSPGKVYRPVALPR